jgi:putative hydrolase of the HAD superfamily
MPTARSHGSRATRVVLFDLFNTLIPGGSRSERDDVSREIATDLGVDPEAFAALIRATYDERMRGKLGGVRETLETLAQRLGAEPRPARLDHAVQRRLALTSRFHSQTWALPALSAIRAAGFRVGVVSDCSAETPEIWADSPIAPYAEATSFSCVTGVRKPAPEAYMGAVRALGAEPSQCVFIGDGGSDELNGAAALGMAVYRFVPPEQTNSDAVEPERDWDGPEIRDLNELVSILLT